MAQKSKIEWTETTWNPVTGCTKVSPGCINCYAERIAYRFAGMHGFPRRPYHFNVTLHEERLSQPISWKKPRLVFINSMSDLFHEEVPFGFIEKVIHIVQSSPQHTFQLLTKRSERLLSLNSQIKWPRNLWIGVSVETSDYLYRIDDLRQIDSQVKFISFEPLLGPIDKIDLHLINWVIVGGESGPNSRVIEKEWVLKIRDICVESSVPFFFKQWGGVNRSKSGRLLEGRIWDEYPKNIVMPSKLK